MASKVPADPLSILRAFVAQHSTQAEAAAALGLSASYLCDLLRRRRVFSDAVLAKLGLQRVILPLGKAS